MKPTTALVLILLFFTLAVCYTIYHTDSGWWIILLFLLDASVDFNDKGDK